MSQARVCVRMELSKTRQQVTVYALIAVFAGLIWILHLAAGMTYPIPWFDEGCYLFPAYSFAKFNTFLGPLFGPKIDTILMPPFHTALMGVLFKISGFSLAAARHASGIFMIASFVLTALALKNYFPKYAVIVLCGLFYTNRFFIITGNNARMESLVLLAAAAGFYCLQKNRDIKGLACLALIPVIHPAGSPIFLAGVFYYLLKPALGLARQPVRTLSASDKIFAAAAVLVWFATWLYLVNHVSAVRSGLLDVQVARKLGRNVFAALFHRQYFTALMFMGFTALVIAVHDRRSFLLLLFAAGAWSIYKIGQELWYDIYEAYAQLLFSVLVLHAGRLLIERSQMFARTLMKNSAVCVLVFFTVFWNFQQTMIVNPLAGRVYWNWYGMHFQDGTRYLDTEDVRVAEGIIKKLENERTGEIVVRFYPGGDALLFSHIVQGRVRIEYPFIADFDRVDLSVFHFSKYNPWNNDQFEALKALNVGPGKVVAREKNATEKWLYVLG